MIRNENQEFTFFLINDIKKYIQIQIWIIQVKKKKRLSKKFSLWKRNRDNRT